MHPIVKNLAPRVLVTGVVVLMAACSGVHSSPKSVVEEFIKVSADGKFDALKSLCSKEAPEDLCNPDVDDREEFVQVMKTAKIVGDPKIEENTALVKVAVTFEGETAEANFPLTKQGDKWFLSGQPEQVES